jgi:hypothetical protein
MMFHAPSYYGSGTSLTTNITSTLPLTTDLNKRYKAVHSAVKSIAVSGGVTFPTSSNISLSKEEKMAITQLQDVFKNFHVILQLCVSVAELYPYVSDVIEDIMVTALMGMRTQL